MTGGDVVGKRKVMPPAQWQEIVDRLRDARYDAGLSQWEVLVKMGYTGSNQVSQWERGHTVPSVAGFLTWVETVGLRVELVKADESGS